MNIEVCLSVSELEPDWQRIIAGVMQERRGETEALRPYLVPTSHVLRSCVAFLGSDPMRVGGIATHLCVL